MSTPMRFLGEADLMRRVLPGADLHSLHFVPVLVDFAVGVAFKLDRLADVTGRLEHIDDRLPSAGVVIDDQNAADQLWHERRSSFAAGR